MLNKRMTTAICLSTLGIAISAAPSFADSKEGIVTASALNVRSGPSTSNSIVTKAYKGDKVEILESSNGWYKIKLSSGTTGWSSGSYISISANDSSSNKTGTVTASALNIRSGAGTSYSIVSKAYKGDTVEILESSNGWYKVKLSSGTTGWASAEYISTTTSSNSSSSNNNSGTTTTTGTVTASALNIRSGAGTSYSIVSKAYKGDTVEILESSNGWCKVKLSSGTTGWASAEYISTTTSSNSSSSNNNSGSTTTTGKTGTVTASALNIRSGAGTNYSVVSKAYKGDTVEIIESSNGWYKVKLSNGTTGWASAEYISTTSSSNSSSSSNNPGSTTTSQNKRETVVNLAYAQLGKPYVWGAEGPNSFDCSGLTYYIYKQAGISIPRSSKEQSKCGTEVSKSNLQPGDLIFSSTDGTGGVSHVAIYVGDGYMIHAPRTGKNVEKVSINNSYWSNAYLWARRVL